MLTKLQICLFYIYLKSSIFILHVINKKNHVKKKVLDDIHYYKIEIYLDLLT